MEPSMPANLLALVVGSFALIWAADRFVWGASAAARLLRVSPLVIGMLVVGFGTSAPELLVSGMAAWSGNPWLSVGNALGSNIANVGLILGAAAVVRPLAVQSGVLRRELPVLLLSELLVLPLLLDGSLGRVDGLLLAGGFVLFVLWTLHMARRTLQPDVLASEYEAGLPRDASLRAALLWLGVGLLVLLASSRLLVWGAVGLAQWLGVSDLVIGLTVVAVGTSLPELATAIVAAVRDEHDVAIGNIVGSNMFNLLAVLSLPGLLGPGPLPHGVLSRDFPVMAIFSVILFAIAWGWRGHPGRVERIEGATLLLAFFTYQAWLYLEASA